MNENDIGPRIRETLNYGLTQLDAPVLAKLRAARQEALRAHGRAHSGAAFGSHLSMKWGVSVAFLIVTLFFAGMWQLNSADTAPESVDASLLAADLPINAYLDNGFQAWSERS